MNQEVYEDVVSSIMFYELSKNSSYIFRILMKFMKF